MSFSSKVKDELAEAVANERHCQTAELAAIVHGCGQIITDSRGRVHLRVQTENPAVARKYFTLSKKAYNIVNSITIRLNSHRISTYILEPRTDKETHRVLGATGVIGETGELHIGSVPEALLSDEKSRRAFLRGCFLVSGSISNPEKTYHLEFVMPDEARAEQVREAVNSFGLDAKIVPRKKAFIVYLKEGDQLVDMLNIMEAHVSLMGMENIRILKDMRNSVNRQMNCDMANIQKTVSAASKQLDDITLINDTIGISELPEALEQIARLRLEQPEATLKELGELLSPPVGKSGVNHRLRKLSEIADSIRAKREEYLL